MLHCSDYRLHCTALHCLLNQGGNLDLALLFIPALLDKYHWIFANKEKIEKYYKTYQVNGAPLGESSESVTENLMRMWP